MLVILVGIITLARLEQLEKAHPSMLVILSGMFTLARLVQLEKALRPILVTLFGIVIAESVSHPRKASSGIAVKALPEILRLTYLFADFTTSATLFSMVSLIAIEIFIDLSGPLTACLSRYAFNSSALLKLLLPPPPPLAALPLLLQAIIVMAITAVKVKIMVLTLLFITKTP